jgi:hypothetical protein
VEDIERVLEAGERFVDRSFGGETILVIGRFLKDILTDFHGLISIGPFACLPTRIIESILTPEAKRTPGHAAAEPGSSPSPANLPFLSIECDGNPFPQTIEAQLEAFCLQVRRTPQAATHARAGAIDRRQLRPASATAIAIAGSYPEKPHCAVVPEELEY